MPAQSTETTKNNNAVRMKMIRMWGGFNPTHKNINKPQHKGNSYPVLRLFRLLSSQTAKGYFQALL